MDTRVAYNKVVGKRLKRPKVLMVVVFVAGCLTYPVSGQIGMFLAAFALGSHASLTAFERFIKKRMLREAKCRIGDEKIRIEYEGTVIETGRDALASKVLDWGDGTRGFVFYPGMIVCQVVDECNGST